MSRQRDPNRYPLTSYVPMEDAVRVYTYCEGKTVKNRRSDSTRPMAMSDCVLELIHKGMKDVVPSATAEKWADRRFRRQLELRKSIDKRSMHGEFKEADAAAAKKAKGASKSRKAARKVAAKRKGAK